MTKKVKKPVKGKKRKKPLTLEKRKKLLSRKAKRQPRGPGGRFLPTPAKKLPYSVPKGLWRKYETRNHTGLKCFFKYDKDLPLSKALKTKLHKQVSTLGTKPYRFCMSRLHVYAEMRKWLKVGDSPPVGSEAVFMPHWLGIRITSTTPEGVQATTETIDFYLDRLVRTTPQPKLIGVELTVYNMR